MDVGKWSSRTAKQPDLKYDPVISRQRVGPIDIRLPGRLQPSSSGHINIAVVTPLDTGDVTARVESVKLIAPANSPPPPL